MTGIALLPHDGGPLRAAVERAGATVVAPERADALVWSGGPDADAIADAVRAAASARWVQLPWAGVERVVGADLFRDGRTWTCAKGVYADPCAELALALLLAGLRDLGCYARAGTWTSDGGVNLLGARLVVLGGGGIARSFARLVAPFEPRLTAVRRSSEPLAGATTTVGPDRLLDAARGADGLVVACALTPETEGIVDRTVLDVLADHACVVNVARGRHVVTDDLVAALEADAIGSAGLDVTDPEPLPDGHPLWAMPNVVVTPHTGNSRSMGLPLLVRRVEENVRRFIAGEELLGLVDPERGY